MDDSANENSASSNATDRRLYVPQYDHWQAQIQNESDRVYCFSKNPGEDFFHLLMRGEIILARGHEKLCLRCAFRLGIATDDRLFWKHPSSNRIQTFE